MRHKRRKKLAPAIGAAALLVAGTAAGLTGAAQANTAQSGPGAEAAAATGNCASSWYGATDEHVEGALTASGETFRVKKKKKMTAASRELPFGTVVRVEDRGDGRSVKVRINDRGPLTDPAHRCTEITGAAFAKLGRDLCSRTTDVTVTVLKPGTEPSPADPKFRPVSMSDCPPGARQRG